MNFSRFRRFAVRSCSGAGVLMPDDGFTGLMMFEAWVGFGVWTGGENSGEDTEGCWYSFSAGGGAAVEGCCAFSFAKSSSRPDMV